MSEVYERGLAGIKRNRKCCSILCLEVGQESLVAIFPCGHHLQIVLPSSLYHSTEFLQIRPYRRMYRAQSGTHVGLCALVARVRDMTMRTWQSIQSTEVGIILRSRRHCTYNRL